MPIPVICPCSAKMKVGDHLAGKHIQCPKCGQVIPVAGANGSPPAPAPAPAPPPPKPAAAQPLGTGDLSDDERERLDNELEQGERVLWADRPDERAYFLRGWGYGSAFFFGAVVCVGIGIGMAAGGLFKDTAGTVIGLILFGVGALSLAAGLACPFLWRSYARKTVYAVTNKRALAWECNWVGKVSLRSYRPGDMARMSRSSMRRDPEAVGSLVFATHVTVVHTDQGSQRFHRHYGFILIRRAGVVEKLLREALIDPFLDRVYDE